MIPRGILREVAAAIVGVSIVKFRFSSRAVSKGRVARSLTCLGVVLAAFGSMDPVRADAREAITIDGLPVATDKGFSLAPPANGLALRGLCQASSSPTSAPNGGMASLSPTLNAASVVSQALPVASLSEGPERPSRFYLRGLAGRVFNGELTFDGAQADAELDTPTGGQDLIFDLDDGFVLGVAAGVFDAIDLPFATLRPEFELNYRQHGGSDFSQLEAVGGEALITELAEEDISADDTVRALGIFANLWIDLDLALPIPLRPFVGGGIGADVVNLGEFVDAGFAWHVGGGANYFVNNHLFVGVEARRIRSSSTGESFGVEADYEANEINGTVGVMF